MSLLTKNKNTNASIEKTQDPSESVISVKNLKKEILKRSGGIKAIPKTSQQTLPYIDAYENGVMQVDTGVFSKTFEFDDISFKTKSDEEQEEIYGSYMKFLNSLNSKEDVFFGFVNESENEQLKLSQISPLLEGDKYDKYRKEIGSMLADKLKSSRNNISTKKYITVRCEEDSVDKAMARLASLSGEIDTSFRKVTKHPLKPIDLSRRLEIMNNILNSKEKNYWFEHDKAGNVKVDFTRMAKQGLTTKDLIAPEFLKFNVNDFQIGERYGQAMYLDGIANWMNTNFMADLCTTNFESSVSLHISPIPQADAQKMVHNQSVNITSEVMEKQKHALQNNYSPEFISADLKNAKAQVDALQEDLMNRDQKMFYMSVTIVHFAESKEELKEQKDIIKNIGAKYMSSIKPLYWQQEKGLMTAMPMGLDKLFSKRLLTTESLGVFIPFDEVSQFDEGGYYYGVNEINKSLIVHNRLKGLNYNGLILGSSGSGKSFSAKREMCSTFLGTNADLYIIDPDGEYTPLAEAFDGTIVNIAPGNGVYINPLDLDIDTSYDKDLNPISMKIDFISGMLETMIGPNAKLTGTQSSIVDKCIKQIYTPYLEHLAMLNQEHPGKNITIDRDNCPTLQNLFMKLMNHPNPEAQYLATIMEKYTTGSSDTFAHRTNIDLNTRVVVYNIKNIGTNLLELALKVCMNDIWNKMIANRSKNKWTWFYVDEFHLLLANDSTSQFLKTVWKRARKWQGVPTGITQNVEDLLNSSAARAIINNSSFVYMLNQSTMDRNMLAELLHLSDNDVEFITNSDVGHGLIFNGRQAIPFADNFPKEFELYKIMTTKAEE